MTIAIKEVSFDDFKEAARHNDGGEANYRIQTYIDMNSGPPPPPRYYNPWFQSDQGHKVCSRLA